MNASKSTDWYSHWTKEYNDLCNSRWKETRDRMAAKFKDADDYILKDYMIPTLHFYKDIDKRMDYLHDFVKKNYDKDKDKFHKMSGRYSHEFNRNHGILKDLIKELEEKTKNKTMKQASDCLQEDAALHTSANCAFYLFAYENLLREFGFLVERLIM